MVDAPVGAVDGAAHSPCWSILYNERCSEWRSQSIPIQLLNEIWLICSDILEGMEPPCRPVMGRGYVQDLEGMMAILINKQHVSDF